MEGLLAKGLKFAPVPFPEIIVAVEGGVKTSGSSMAQEARMRISSFLVISRPQTSNLHPAEHKAVNTSRKMRLW